MSEGTAIVERQRGEPVPGLDRRGALWRSVGVGGVFTLASLVGLVLAWAVGPAGFGVVISIYLLWWLGLGLRRRAVAQQLTLAAAARAEGNHAQARHLLEDALAIGARVPDMQAVVVLSLAECRMDTADYADAMDLLTQLQRSGVLDASDMPALLELWSNAALCSVLLGNVDDARAAMDRVRPHVVPINLLTLDVLCALRSELYAEAQRMIDEHWDEAERSLLGVEIKQLRLLKAFATHRLAGVGYRAATGQVQEQLDALRPFRPGEWDPLSLHWPELRSFLELHGLAAE